MSIDLYHFHTVLRQQETVRAERLAADVQAARAADLICGLGRAAGRAGRALRATRSDVRRASATV